MKIKIRVAKQVTFERQESPQEEQEENRVDDIRTPLKTYELDYRVASGRTFS
jgi:hypothetical protein